MRCAVPLASLVLVLAGCDEPAAMTERDAGPSVFGDVQYAVRCLASGDCAGVTNVDVCGFAGGQACDGIPGTAEVTCDATDGRYSFTASQGGPTLTIDGFDDVGGGADCMVTLEIDGATFSGACNGSGPCEITSIRTYDDRGNPTIEGHVYCEGLSSASGSTREITALGNGPAPEISPGRFRLAWCSGLAL